MGPMYPEVIVHRPERANFEEALRELVRNMPYLGIALLVHLVVLLVFANMRITLPVEGEGPVIKAREPETVVLDPPEPLELEKPLETPEELPIDPQVHEDFQDLAMVDDPTDTPAFTGADVGVSGIIGVGIGSAESGGGPRGLSGGRPEELKAERNIRAGLLWLKHHQDPRGFWSASAFSDQCGQQGGDTICDGRGSPRFDVGVSGLALLAFLGAGSTDRWGEHQDVVKRALAYLMEIQEDDGLIGSRDATQHTYDHAIATLALCEAYSRSGTFRLKRAANEALRYLYAMRTTGTGWRYAPDHPEMADPARRADTSVTGWAILVMIVARKAGLSFDEVAFEDAMTFLDEMTDPTTGRTGYFSRGGRVAREEGLDGAWPDDQSEATTAVAILCRVLADPELERPGAERLVAQGAELIEALPPVWSDGTTGRRDYYYWYYGAYALFQVGTRQQWKVWEDAIFDVVMQRQHTEGELAGSWDPQHDPWGHLGGRVYSTAILTLLAEVYFRYPSLLAEGR